MNRREDTLSAQLARLRHLAVDLDGTLYRGAQVFPATLPFLERLRRLGIGFTFLTNNTSRSKVDYVAKLRAMGIDAAEEQICTPADCAIALLRNRFADVHSVAILGTPSLCRQFAEAGFSVSWTAPEAVVVGFDTTLTYERLCHAAYWISQGLPFIATHPDVVCPTDEATVLVDCGAICASLTAATKREPIVLGKPDPGMLLGICQRHGLRPEELGMVGDRLYTDIRMARRAGAAAVLVLSGEASAADAAVAPDKPDLIVADVEELARRLEQARPQGLFQETHFPKERHELA